MSILHTKLSTRLDTIPGLNLPTSTPDFPLPASLPRERAQRLYNQWAKTSTCYVSLNNQNHFFFEEQGEAYLAYRKCWRVAITVGEPVGSAEGIRRCVSQFLDFCQREKLIPAFFAIQNELEVYRASGLKELQVAEDPYLDLTRLTFKGKCWQDVRTALNRAERQDIELRRLTGASGSQVTAQLELVSQEWLGNKKLPELGFFLGNTKSLSDPRLRVYYAIERSSGKIQGFVSWQPVNGSNGWALDMMRRGCDAMPGLIEFMIARSALEFKAEGFESLALGAAPLAPVQQPRRLCIIERGINQMLPVFNRYYTFSSLYHFKRKFNPEWRPLYLFYPSLLKLPLVSFALVYQYLAA
ncbi:MAG TPA: DUF2156 domain-containing protein [Chloroflexia bacterium]|nr:DUF2156 domain-containing protein [Chloroflexia bacterium]